MGIHNVTLEGYTGWTPLLVWSGIIFVLWLAFFIYMGRYPRTAWNPGTTYVGWPWFARWFSMIGMMLVIAVLSIIGVSQSGALENAERAEALASVGVENVEYFYREDKFVGTLDGNTVFGYFTHVEGDEWRLIIGNSVDVSSAD